MDALAGKQAVGTASGAAARVNEMLHVGNGLDGMATDVRAAARARELKPLTDSFSEWREGLAPTLMEGTPPDKAAVHARNQFPHLHSAVSDGRPLIENSRAEIAFAAVHGNRANHYPKEFPRDCVWCWQHRARIVRTSYNDLTTQQVSLSQERL